MDMIKKVVAHDVGITIRIVFKVLELFSCLITHYYVSKFSWEWNVNWAWQVRDLCREHVLWDHCHVYLVAVFTSVSNRVFLDLFAALGTTVIDHFVVNSHMLYECANFVELWLLLCSTIIPIVIKSNFIYDFLDQLEIFISRLSAICITSGWKWVMIFQSWWVLLKPFSKFIHSLVIRVNRQLTVFISRI